MRGELTKTDSVPILGLPASRKPDVLILGRTRNLRSKYKAMVPHASVATVPLHRWPDGRHHRSR
jgi:hypothetical protein